MSLRHARVQSLSGKIFNSVLVFTLSVIVALSVLFTSIFYLSIESSAQTALKEQAKDAAARLNTLDSSEAEQLLSDQISGTIRYTLIASDGSVLFDNMADESALSSHSDRPEIQQAKASGEGFVWRFSDTLQSDTVYVAIALDNGNVIRLSEARESLFSFVGGIVWPVIIVVVVAILLVLMLSRVLTRRIMKPIDALDFSDPLENEIYDEMNPLLARIDEQQQLLKTQNEELARAENVRRDFSSNVSHEMKTPLQVISGYAELMKNGLVAPDDNRRFAALVYEEAQAMSALINDVLTLSRLDESSFEEDGTSPVDLRAIAYRVRTRLESLSADRKVNVSIEGPASVIAGSETLAEAMIYNLVENAIRYNYEGGSVWVRFSSEPVNDAYLLADRKLSPAQAAQLRHGTGTPLGVQIQIVVMVEDTGTGIPEELREKVFERFYRMEKSRSKETGGTGLGLAIVKHAVLYHKGTIEVGGAEDTGTIFTLRFPALQE